MERKITIKIGDKAFPAGLISPSKGSVGWKTWKLSDRLKSRGR
jgi:hypothetical protein